MPTDRRVSARRNYGASEVEQMAAKYRTWGQWGEDDELGSMNYVSPEVIRAASTLVHRGTVFSLAIPFDRDGPMPGISARVNPQHVMYRHGGDFLANWEELGRGMQSTDDGVYMPLQCATQWDAFSHVFYNGQTYNGRGPETVTSAGASRNSITQMRDRVVGRGVLLDFPRFYGVPWLEPTEAIQDVDLAACAEHQGVEVKEGDFVLVRTGHLQRRRAEPRWGDFAAGPAPGLGLSACDFLLPRRVAAVATDTWGVEVVPCESLPEVRFGMHVILLVNAGVLMGEMWDLDVLAADCADDAVYEFLLTAAPLTITGAVGSPLNPLAIK